MKKIKIIDSNFSHADYMSDFQKSKYFVWDRNLSSPLKENELLIVTDNFISNNISNNKIALLIEPKSINPNIYEYVKNNNLKFNKILTFDKEILNSIPNSIFYPFGGCWIEDGDKKVHKKNKLVSIIVSEKNSTIGHKLRHEIVRKFGDIIDVYGRGYNSVDKKIEALQDYKYSIVIENDKFDYYFTEKINDCFATGTVPIYWGCPSIEDFYNKNGIISFDSLDELDKILQKISEQDYQNRYEFILENFTLLSKYQLPEDWIFENVFEKLFSDLL
jgi:hypothetical protein